MENLFGNVYKYALEGTRVYLDLAVKETDGQKLASFSMKNISAQSLNISADELTERFIRGMFPGARREAAWGCPSPGT